MKTGLEVEEDFYKALKAEGGISEAVSGTLYRDETRPRDSKAEDIVIRLTSLGQGQIQSGVLTLLIYVQDVSLGKGNLVRNSARLSELATAAQKTADVLWQHLPSDYAVCRLYEGINSQIVKAIGQHFLSVRLYFEILNQNY